MLLTLSTFPRIYFWWVLVGQEEHYQRQREQGEDMSLYFAFASPSGSIAPDECRSGIGRLPPVRVLPVLRYDLPARGSKMHVGYENALFSACIFRNLAKVCYMFASFSVGSKLMGPWRSRRRTRSSSAPTRCSRTRACGSSRRRG